MASPSSSSSSPSSPPLPTNLNGLVASKLTAENYTTWRHQIESLLIAYELEDHINSDLSSPPSTLSGSFPNPDFLLWRRRDQLVKSWLVASSSPNIVALIAPLSTAVDVWIFLRNYFLSQSRARTFQLRASLHNLKKGRDVFERLLIDSDWAINNGNWLWLSCSSFFYQYNRIYSPTSFGKKYDPNGDFIRHFLPVLKDMPKEYIYEPWTAPLSVQREAHCIIGSDYPKPVVSHEIASKDCKQRMGEAYKRNSKSNVALLEEGNRSRRKPEDSEVANKKSVLTKKRKNI